MKVYISGKIGEEVLTEVTRWKFDKTARILRAHGYEVFNPTRSGFGILAEEAVKNFVRNGEVTTWYAQVLMLDLEELERCDAIYMLPDWKQSPGALVEYHFAEAIGKQIFFAVRRHAEHYLHERWIAIPENGEKPLCRTTIKEMEDYIAEHISEAYLDL